LIDHEAGLPYHSLGSLTVSLTAIEDAPLGRTAPRRSPDHLDAGRSDYDHRIGKRIPADALEARADARSPAFIARAPSQIDPLSGMRVEARMIVVEPSRAEAIAVVT